MKIYVPEKGQQCDECDKKFGKKSIGILIGEHSHDFEHDTCQAFLCIDCVKRALIIMEDEKL